MATDPAPEDARPHPAAQEDTGKALHGTPSEVRWRDGQGRQPYENQNPALPADPAAADVPEGDRGAASGRNLEDLEKVREKRRDAP